MKHQFFSILVLSGLIFALTQPSKAAAKVVFSEDFSENLNKWQPTRDSGQYWQIKDGKAEVSVPTRSTITELVPKDEFWNKDWKNIEYSYELTPMEGVDRNTSFGWEDLRNWFEVHFVDRLVNIVRVDDGSLPYNIFKNYAMKNGQTYKIKIKILDKVISVFVDDQLISESTDQSYQSSGGKIGLKAGTGAVYPTKLVYDNIEVNWLEDQDQVNLAVPIFKQSDERWKNDEYDHASNWSETPTISRWGCLTSSMAMVMNFHGINKMPDGSELNPQSLNNWLKSQADGYIGEGQFNWMAAARLTKQISDVYGTPKLEYQRISLDPRAAAISSLTKGLPPILEIPGHFLVARGIDALGKILINDPAYIYQTLAEHSKDLVSTRILTPSHTDLSYLLVSNSPNLNVELFDPNGELIESFTDQLLADNGDGETAPATIVHEVAKPVAGKYKLEISAPTLQSFHLNIYSYDKTANPTDLSFDGLVGQTPLEFEINLSDDGSVTIQAIFDLSMFRQVLQELYSHNLIAKLQIFNQLDRIALKALLDTTNPQFTSINQLVKLVNAFDHWLVFPTKEYLLQLSNYLKSSD